jgi:GNAT superfamily N-acetyltransferase
VVFGKDKSAVAGADGVLLKLYVVPEHGGQGIGRVLHDRAVAGLTSAGHRTARLWVLERNLVARRMYERHGWRLEPRSRSDFPGSGILEVGYSLVLPIRL